MLPLAWELYHLLPSMTLRGDNFHNMEFPEPHGWAKSRGHGCRFFIILLNVADDASLIAASLDSVLMKQLSGSEGR